MQAIILAAGMGKRLGNLTKDNTKCMVKVNGIPLIDRVLGQLSHFPLSKVILVIGYKGEKLKEYLGFDYQGLPIQYIENSIYDKTNNIYLLYRFEDKQNLSGEAGGFFIRRHRVAAGGGDFP